MSEVSVWSALSLSGVRVGGKGGESLQVAAMQALTMLSEEESAIVMLSCAVVVWWWWWFRDECTWGEVVG